MKPPPFIYHDPDNLEEALSLIGSLDNAKILAGGQSLMPMLNMRYVLPDHVIDLNRIKDLSYIRERDGRIEIGAMTRQRDLEFSDLLWKYCPLMRKALVQVGHRQTRNRGTIGGSLCHLDPAAELTTVLAVLDARVSVIGSNGKREISISEFPAFYMTPAIEPDEIVTSINFAYWSAGHHSSFVEFSRRPGDFAVIGVGVMLNMDTNNTIKQASIALAGAGSAPVRCSDAEKILIGSRAEDSLIQRAAATCRDINAMADVYASSAYRKHLAVELTARAINTAITDLA